MPTHPPHSARSLEGPSWCGDADLSCLQLLLGVSKQALGLPSQRLGVRRRVAPSPRPCKREGRGLLGSCPVAGWQLRPGGKRLHYPGDAACLVALQVGAAGVRVDGNGVCIAGRGRSGSARN